MVKKLFKNSKNRKRDSVIVLTRSTLWPETCRRDDVTFLIRSTFWQYMSKTRVTACFLGFFQWAWRDRAIGIISSGREKSGSVEFRASCLFDPGLMNDLFHMGVEENRLQHLGIFAFPMNHTQGMVTSLPASGYIFSVCVASKRYGRKVCYSEAERKKKG